MPAIADAIDSVAPLVKTTSRDRAPMSPATDWRACSTAWRVVIPSSWMRPGSPVGPLSHETIAATASGRAGLVDAWSR